MHRLHALDNSKLDDFWADLFPPPNNFSAQPVHAGSGAAHRHLFEDGIDVQSENEAQRQTAEFLDSAEGRKWLKSVTTKFSTVLEKSTRKIRGKHREEGIAPSTSRSATYSDQNMPPRGGVFAQLYSKQLSPLLKAVRDVLCQCAHDARSHALQTLKFQVGSLGERFGTYSTWLFVPCGKNMLRSIATYNATNGDLRLKVTGKRGQGIVPHVAFTGEPYFCDNVDEDPWYREEVGETKSELAVPILSPDNRVLGVLNFESCEFDAFSQKHADQLAVEAGELVSQLLVLDRLNRKDDSWCPWNPRTQGWDLAGGRGNVASGRQFGLLQSLCEAVTASLGENNTTCTLWYVDVLKDELFVLATIGYDYEFLTRKSLLGESFTKGVAQMKRGSSRFGRLADFPEFIYFEKAQKRGLKKILSGPVHLPGQTPGKPAAAVLSIYSTDHRPREAFPDDRVLSQFYEILGTLIANVQSQRCELADAYLLSRLNAQSQAPYAAVEIIKQTLVDILELEACSIFASRPEDRSLYCVATTGLEPPHSLRSSVRRTLKSNIGVPVAYDLDQDRGLTTYLAKHPGEVVRKNDIPNEHEKGVPPGLPACTDKHRERCAGVNSQHRRFLGVGFPVQNRDTSTGVIRLIRGVQSKPFTEFDQHLLLRLSKTLRGVFPKWYPDSVIYTSGDRPTESSSRIRDTKSLFDPEASMDGLD
jgi:hypothetical protein